MHWNEAPWCIMRNETDVVLRRPPVKKALSLTLDPAVDPENESELQPVQLNGNQNSSEIGYRSCISASLYSSPRPSAVSRSPDSTINYEDESATFLGKSTYLVDFAPLIFICLSYEWLRVKPAKSHSAKDVNRIDHGLLDDLAPARSDVETKEIVYRCQIGSLHTFAEYCIYM